jgi:hypothetical protein
LSCISSQFLRIRFFFLLCLIFSFQLDYAAGDITGLTNLPRDRQYLANNNRTQKVLKALLYENRQLYQSAYLVWKTLPQHLMVVQEHVFQSGLFRSTGAMRKSMPRSESASLLMSRYLAWQRKWEEALQVLKEAEDGKPLTFNAKLEVIRLHLSLGNYSKARQIMATIGEGSRREQLQLKILKTWCFILTGEAVEAKKLIGILEEDFLYLPISTMFPLDFFGRQFERKRLLRKSLIRYPSSDSLLEQYIKLLQSTRNWQELDLLIRSQQVLDPDAFHWSLEAEVCLRTGRSRELDQLLKSPLDKDILPEYFDLIARKAINEENWELLNRVSIIYRAKFPGLEDGRLYQTIYLQKTGQLNSRDLSFIPANKTPELVNGLSLAPQ